MVRQKQQIRDLLECVWPAALTVAAHPLKSRTWAATLAVVLGLDGADLARTRRLGADRLQAQVTREIGRWGGQRVCRRIVTRLYAPLGEGAGVLAHRRGALERVDLLLDDWQHTRTRLADVEQRMLTVLDELGLTDLVPTIPGLSAPGAAAILAQTGDLSRFTSARAVVKHAGPAPREKTSGNFTGRTKLTGQGRPGLRLAAWRVVWGAQAHNPVYAARYTHLTTRDHNRLTATQAQTVIAAAILRQLRRGHHRPGLGPRHRHPRHPTRPPGGSLTRTPRTRGPAPAARTSAPPSS